MINHDLLRSQNELNRFTKALVKEIDKQTPYRIVQVELLNGDVQEVTYTINEEGEYNFHTLPWKFCWNADGSSVTNKEFDLIYFIRGK